MSGRPQRRGRRPARQRQPRGASVVGRRFEVVVGPIAHGGHCIARVETAVGEQRVVFTRHALPGERVVLEITEGTEGDRFWRGDAVEILDSAAGRREPLCPVSGPGGCGGCDFQHVELPVQRDLKTAVVREQLVRLGGLAAEDRLLQELTVRPVPGDQEGLRWRTRTTYVDLPDGQRGLRAHRSHDVVVVEDCLITAPPVEMEPTGTVTRSVTTEQGEHSFEVAADGFWQVHPGAPTVLVETVMSMLAPQPGERVLDLYAGVGLFAAFLADVVGPEHVTAIEADPTASGLSRANCPGARVICGSVREVLTELDCPPADLVVLDPPREGAKQAVVEQIVSCAPRAVAYVACDPAALARDVKIFAQHRYELTGLEAFDLFPMTHHVECVALLARTGSGQR